MMTFTKHLRKYINIHYVNIVNKKKQTEMLFSPLKEIPPECSFLESNLQQLCIMGKNKLDKENHHQGNR